MQIINHIVIKDGEARIERKPYLKAEMVARMYIDGDHSIEDVMQHYELEPAEVHAAIAYYYDNRDALDAAYQAAIEEIRGNAMSLTALEAKLRSRSDPTSS